MRYHKVACWAISGSFVLSTVCAAPSLNFPVNSQVPPVGLVAQQYSFTFEKSTFVSSAPPVSYSLRNEPSWLHFDNKTRTFSGTVTTDTAGPVTFDLVASDSDGSTISEVNLFTTDQKGPQLGKAVLPQLSEAGPVSAPSSLLLHALESFYIDFSHDTFSNTAKHTNFYATSADNSPLPSWLQFDPRGIRFSGRGPPLVSPPGKAQEYGVRLIASDIPGFAQAVANFQIVIGNHVLVFSRTSQVVKVSPDLAFQSQPLRKGLMLDGRLVDDAELAMVTSDAPEWARLDADKISVEGTPPQGATSQSILIQATDVFGNTANTSVKFLISDNQDGLFSANLPSANASIGHDFRYSLVPSALSSDDVQVTADLTNVSSWMTYDATSMTLSGFVPSSLRRGTVLVTFNATLGAVTEKEQLRLNVVGPSASSRSSQMSKEPTSSTEHPHSQPTSDSNEGSKDQKRRLAVVLAITIPMICLLGLVGLILYSCWRRQRAQIKLDQSSYISTAHPVTCRGTEQGDAAKAAEPFSTPEAETPASPPRIELLWAPDSLKMSRARSSKVMANRQSQVSDSEWGDLVIPETPERTQGARGAQRLSRNDSDTSEALAESGDWTPFMRNRNTHLNYPRRRAALRASQAKVRKSTTSSHASKSLKTLSSMSIGLPGRLSGAGHGAGGPRLPEVAPVRQSWQNNVDSLPSQDGRSTPFDLNSFPEPPTGQKETKERPLEWTMKSSIRLVPSSSSHSWSLEEQRQKWVRDRARDRYGQGSRFSHTQSSTGRSTRSKLRPSNPDSLSKLRSIPRSWSQSSVMGAPDRLEYGPRRRSPKSSLARQPSNLRRVLSTVSSGRLNSVESRSNSSWVDDLMEEEDEQGRRRWVALGKSSQQNPVLPDPILPKAGSSELGSWGKNARTGGLGALRDSIQGGGLEASSGVRRWRLGGEQAKRPISVDEGELQRSLGSQRGNLAFV